MTPRFLLTGCTVFSLVVLGACDAAVFHNNPSFTTPNRAEVYNDRAEQEFPTAALKEAQVDALSRAYGHDGQGPMIVSVTYDPASRTNTALKASAQAAKLASALRMKGVRDVKAGALAVAESGQVSRTLVSYDTLAARPPAECDEPLNMRFAEREYRPDYRLGCSIEIYTARQVARPADLTGNDVLDNGSGRRDANIIEGYQSGAYKELQGVNASEASAGN